jgi:charged multivesicular body protein 5
MYEAQRDQMSAQAFNIDQTAFAIDTVKDTQTTVAAMKIATKTLKVENKKINLNEIENMQDELEGIYCILCTFYILFITIVSLSLLDLLLDTNEISETLGRSYGVGDEIDDADLDAELACLEDELEGEALDYEQPAYLKPSSLPMQPLNEPITAGPSSAPAAVAKLDEYGLPMNA